MRFLTRQSVLALGLLLLFVVAALLAQAWLQRESRRFQADAIAAKGDQMTRALECLPLPGSPAEEEAFRSRLGRLIDATVTAATSAPVDAKTPGLLAFDCRLSGERGALLRVSFAAPAAGRLAAAHERMLVAITLLAVLFLTLVTLLGLQRRGAGGDDTRAPWDTARAERLGVEHFARMSVEHAEALDRESGARHRAEEDLQVSRSLLDQSLEHRVRLGRELHDNLCQSLYALCLTLESLRPKLAGSGAEARLEQCIAELRRLNREVRAHLRDLEPAAMHGQAFAEALASMLAALAAGSRVRIDRDLEAEALGLISPEQTTELVNLLREAVSNSLRHSGADAVSIHARRGDRNVVFAVQDNGAGFDLAEAEHRGHGLSNLRARATVLGAEVRVVTAPGKGTRVSITLPVTSAP